YLGGGGWLQPSLQHAGEGGADGPVQALETHFLEFQDVVRGRRMVRSFEDRPLPRDVVERILANAQRAPSAGFSQGWAFVVLEGREQTARFWSATFADDAARAAFRWQGLFRAPLVVVPLAHKQAYLDRYAEPDKGWTD